MPVSPPTTTHLYFSYLYSIVFRINYVNITVSMKIAYIFATIMFSRPHSTFFPNGFRLFFYTFFFLLFSHQDIHSYNMIFSLYIRYKRTTPKEIRLVFAPVRLHFSVYCHHSAAFPGQRPTHPLLYEPLSLLQHHFYHHPIPGRRICV